MLKPKQKKIIRIISIVLLVITGINAVSAGFAFITDPTGGSLGFRTTYLNASSPFKDFFIPGIVLFFIIGIPSFGIAIATLKEKARYYRLILLQGCLLVIWIAVQLALVVSPHFLHAVVAGVGLFLIVCGWLLKSRQSEDA